MDDIPALRGAPETAPAERVAKVSRMTFPLLNSMVLTR
jgi:hypothetical protein